MPRTGILYIAERCNQQCVFCLEEDGTWNEFVDPSTQQVFDTLRALRDRGVDHVTFMGGETFFRKDLPRIVGEAKRLGITRLGVTTNGTVLSKPGFVRELAAAGLDFIELSIHGHTAALANAIGGTHFTFERQAAALAELDALGTLPTIVNVVVCRENVAHLVDVARYVCESFPRIPARIKLKFASLTGLALERARRGEVLRYEDVDFVAVGDYLAARGVPYWFYDVPLCRLGAHASASHELGTLVAGETYFDFDHRGRGEYYDSGNQLEGRVWPSSQCARCTLAPLCPGIEEPYRAALGDGALVARGDDPLPLVAKGLVDRGLDPAIAAARLEALRGRPRPSRFVRPRPEGAVRYRRDDAPEPIDFVVEPAREDAHAFVTTARFSLGYRGWSQGDPRVHAGVDELLAAAADAIRDADARGASLEEARVAVASVGRAGWTIESVPRGVAPKKKRIELPIVDARGPATRATRRPRSIGVLGGGTSGWFAALALKRRFPDVAVTVVESKDIPIIGVGEATTTLMPPFLHGQLGLDPVALFREVRPTFKLGIKFEWGLPGPDYFFTYPFGDADPIDAFALERDLRRQSLVSMLMCADRAPMMRGPEGEIVSLMPQVKVGYHLDNAPFVAFLSREAAARGILHETMSVEAVVLDDGGTRVEALLGDDGRTLRFDFLVDASGFRSRLLEGALGSSFESFASSLFCDRAIVATVAQRGPVQPYTTAETMDAGWCWRIPVVGEDHRGYVHSSAFVSEERAVDEMRAKNPGMGEPWIVRFRSGRHRDFWIGNVAAIGNAYGFVEPLESTALHMVIVELAYLLAGLEAMDGPPEEATRLRAFANESIAAHWDYLRWFLAVHYKFNRRSDSAFWRAARADVDVSGLGAEIDRLRREGPWLEAAGRRFAVGDATFGWRGLMMMMLGQHVDAPVAPRTTKAAWAKRVEGFQRVVGYALPQTEMLAELAADPRHLLEFVSSPRSWCAGTSERVDVQASRPVAVHPKGGADA